MWGNNGYFFHVSSMYSRMMNDSAMGFWAWTRTGTFLWTGFNSRRRLLLLKISSSMYSYSTPFSFKAHSTLLPNGLTQKFNSFTSSLPIFFFQGFTSFSRCVSFSKFMCWFVTLFGYFRNLRKWWMCRLVLFYIKSGIRVEFLIIWMLTFQQLFFSQNKRKQIVFYFTKKLFFIKKLITHFTT